MSHDVLSDRKLGLTAYWTAVVRTYETTRPDQLFQDPWADKLVGREGCKWIEGKSVVSIAPIILRTRYFDDFLQHITLEKRVRNIILMATGLDTRAFQLSWPEQIQIYELDQTSVLEEKEAVLESVGARSACKRQITKVDLASDWSDALMTAGLNPEQVSGWLLEGFLFYMPNESIIDLLSKVSQLAMSGSWLGFDIVNRVSLTYPLV